MKARMNHAAATGRGGGGGALTSAGGALTSVGDQQKIQELERTVEALHMKNAVSLAIYICIFHNTSEMLGTGYKLLQ